jgi:hypothetical protein
LWLNDVFKLDTVTWVWTELSNSTRELAPSPRIGAGFAAIEGRLYVFAGQDNSGSK